MSTLILILFWSRKRDSNPTLGGPQPPVLNQLTLFRNILVRLAGVEPACYPVNLSTRS